MVLHRRSLRAACPLSMPLLRGRHRRMLLGKEAGQVSTVHEVHQVSCLSIELDHKINFAMPSFLMPNPCQPALSKCQALSDPSAHPPALVQHYLMPTWPLLPKITFSMSVFRTTTCHRHFKMLLDSSRNSIDPALTRFPLSQTPPTCPANSSGKAPARPAPLVPSAMTSELPPRRSASTLQRCVQVPRPIPTSNLHICHRGLAGTELGCAGLA